MLEGCQAIADLIADVPADPAETAVASEDDGDDGDDDAAPDRRRERPILDQGFGLH